MIRAMSQGFLLTFLGVQQEAAEEVPLTGTKPAGANKLVMTVAWSAVSAGDKIASVVA